VSGIQFFISKAQRFDQSLSGPSQVHLDHKIYTIDHNIKSLVTNSQ